MNDHQNYFANISSSKSGTSWLHSYLRNNTTADMPFIKEFHWFDEVTGKTSGFHQEAVDRWEMFQMKLNDENRPLRANHEQFRDRAMFQSDNDYAAFFKRHCKPNSVFGDITPSYSTLDKSGFKRIKNLFPKVKFICIHRNPADRIWSAANMMAERSDTEPSLIFNELLYPDYPSSQESNCKMTYDNAASVVGEDNIYKELLSPDHPYRQESNFKMTYQNAASVVGKDNIFQAFQEEMFGANRDLVLEKLCNFLSVEDNGNGRESLRDNRRDYQTMPKVLRQKAVTALRYNYDWAIASFGYVPDCWKIDMENCSSC